MPKMRMSQKQWNKLKLNQLLHIGAHRCEEAGFYDRAGVKRVLWVEANPAIIDEVIEEEAITGHHKLIQGLVSDVGGKKVEFHIANNGESSSMLHFGTHRSRHKKVLWSGHIHLVTTTVDTICHTHSIIPDVLCMDIQGAELLALKGATAQLTGPTLRHIYLEVNFEHLYRGCPLMDELTDFLAPHGFKQVSVFRTKHGWGDALYSRPNDYDPTRNVR